MKKVKVGLIMKSSEAFDAYQDATGETPPVIPEGMNTFIKPFILTDEDGIDRAATLISQKGFEQTQEEIEKNLEASGLSIAIAMDADVELGRRALDEFIDKMLAPTKTTEGEKNGIR